MPRFAWAALAVLTAVSVALMAPDACAEGFQLRPGLGQGSPGGGAGYLTVNLPLAVLVLTVLFAMLSANRVRVVVFETGYGRKIVMARRGKPLAVPEEPVREGFVFAGWHRDWEPYDFSRPIDDSMILRATWMADPAEARGPPHRSGP